MYIVQIALFEPIELFNRRGHYTMDKEEEGEYHTVVHVEHH